MRQYAVDLLALCRDPDGSTIKDRGLSSSLADIGPGHLSSAHESMNNEDEVNLRVDPQAFAKVGALGDRHDAVYVTPPGAIERLTLAVTLDLCANG